VGSLLRRKEKKTAQFPTNKQKVTSQMIKAGFERCAHLTSPLSLRRI
jgi:hypothetical protein